MIEQYYIWINKQKTFNHFYSKGFVQVPFIGSSIRFIAARLDAVLNVVATPM